MTDASSVPRIGLLFSGQGSQRAGMGAPWTATPSWEIVDRIAGVSGHDIGDLLLHADDATLTRTDRAQIATFALEMVILAEVRRTRTVAEPVTCAAGHSLGEYAALVAAGVVDLATGSRLVAARGAAMLAAAEANPGSMIAVLGPDDETVAAAIAPLQAQGVRVWIANRNAPGQTVLAGDAEGLAAATDALGGHRAKTRALPVGGAFHSPLMAPAETALRAALDDATFRDGHVPVVANVDAQPHHDAAAWRDLLARQLTAPVSWTASVRTMVDTFRCERFVEIGPGDTLSAMVKRIARDVPCAPVNAV